MLRRFAAFTRRLYDLEVRHFIDRNLDSPLDLLRPALARLAAMGGFRRLAPVVASYLRAGVARAAPRVDIYA